MSIFPPEKPKQGAFALHPTDTEMREAIEQIKRENCPLCYPEILERPQIYWHAYRNCEAHNQKADEIREGLMARNQATKLPPGWVPPYERELEVEQRSQNADSSHSEPLSEPLPPKGEETPIRSLRERFENAEMILMRDRMKWTPAQEAKFKDKWSELCNLYWEDDSFCEAPGLRYNKDGFLEVERPLMSFWKVLS